MRPRPPGARALVVSLLVSLAGMSVHAASPDASLVSVAAYLAAFADAYSPGDYAAGRLLDAEASVQRADSASAPELTFEQSLDWTAYRTLDLALETGMRLPLYDSLAGPSRALADADLMAALAAVASARADAEASFLFDLATYAALSEAAAGLELALERLGGAPWLTDPAFEPLELPTGDRGLYEAHLRLLEMHGFLSSQQTEVTGRIARLARVAEDRLVAPSSQAVRAVVPAPLDAAACLLDAPSVAAARLRHHQAVLMAELDATPSFTVGLTTDLSVALAGTGPGAGPGAGFGAGFGAAPAAGVGAVQAAGLGALGWQASPSATFALEARLALPPSRVRLQDVDASLSASATSSGASQSLRLSWPGPVHAVMPYVDPDEQLARELHDAASELRALRRAVDQAAAERARQGRALDWLLLDTVGFTSAAAREGSDVTARPAALLAALPVAVPPRLTAQVADLSAQLAFAELDEVFALVQLATACGAWQ